MMKRLRVLLPVLWVLLLAKGVLAQPVAGSGLPEESLWSWVKSHGSVVSGIAVADGERSEFVSVAIDVDAELAPKLRAFGSLSLFGRQRAGESEPQLPGSLDALALYSAGEAVAGAYWAVSPKLAIECRGGVIFAMSGFTGAVGAPVDPSKYLGGCGARVTGTVGRLSVIFGHSGPVTEGARLWGFVPSTVIDGEFPLGRGMAALIQVSAGRELGTEKAVTSARVSVRKGF